jgi:ATP adenylyltransferase
MQRLTIYGVAVRVGRRERRLRPSGRTAPDAPSPFYAAHPGGGAGFIWPPALIQSQHPGMHIIWSPWRMAYIEGQDEETGCLFCTRRSQEDGPENLIVHRGQRAFVILNRYPYTNGHMMIVPNRHHPTIEGLDPPTLEELMVLSQQAMAALRKAYNASAFNVGINIGDAAGAGVADHVHIHVVPRWKGDTNFMATAAQTRIIPEALRDTYARLRQAWPKGPGGEPPHPDS